VVATLAVVTLIGYLIGSVPFGYLVGRAAGIDVRKFGSGNIGATNVVRVLGRRYGYPVFALDFLKGAVAVQVSLLISGGLHQPQPNNALWGIVGGTSSVIGHSYPVWLSFKGGKGVATSGGVIFSLMPFAALIVGVVWIVMFLMTRYVSVASICAAVALPVAVGGIIYLRQQSAIVLLYFSIFLAVVVVIRHRSNLSRLLNGTEPRFHRR
jgi:acyl phosphate:glycerol-3-phosphate acyltransferase